MPLAAEVPVFVTAAVTEIVPPRATLWGEAEMFPIAKATPAVDVPTVKVSALLFHISIVTQWSVNTPIFTVYVPAPCPAAVDQNHWNAFVSPVPKLFPGMYCWKTRLPALLKTSMSTMIPVARLPLFFTEVVMVAVAPGATGSGVVDVLTTEKLGAALAPVAPSAPRTAVRATSARSDLLSEPRRICTSM